MIKILYQQLGNARESGATAEPTNENNRAAENPTITNDDDDDTTNGATAVAAAPATTDDASPENILIWLEKTKWQATHTVLLADTSSNNADDDTDDADGNAGRGEDDETTLNNRSINLIFSSDLSHGLPAYVFEPLENKVRILQIREKNESEPLEEDFEVINNLLANATEEISNSGYVGELSLQHGFTFYDIPELGIDTEN